MYTALVLDAASQQKLITSFKGVIPATWKVIAHHMTINMGPAVSPVKEHLNQPAKLTVIALGQDDKVMAAQVVSDIPSANKVKHITLAVNTQAGGKPVMSNNLTTWNQVSPIELTGILQEVN